MPNGLKIALPVTFTNPGSLPIILPSLGTTVAPSHRWAARSIAGVAAGQIVPTWTDNVALKNLTPNAKDTNPDQVAPNLRVDSGSGEQYVHLGGASTVTFDAATDVATFNQAHGLSVGDQIQFSDVATVVGVAAKTTYYVKTVPSSTTITLSAASGGATLDITTNGTGNWVQGLSLLAADLTAANHKTVAFLFRRPAGNGLLWSGTSAILNQSGTGVTLTSSGTVTPTTSIFTGWHIAVVRIGGAGVTDFWIDGIKTATDSTLAATAITGYSLNAEASTTSTAATDYVEAISFASLLSDADVAQVRTALKAAYSGLSGGIA